MGLEAASDGSECNILTCFLSGVLENSSDSGRWKSQVCKNVWTTDQQERTAQLPIKYLATTVLKHYHTNLFSQFCPSAYFDTPISSLNILH